MSSKYKFQFTGTATDDSILWMLESRLGAIWTGTLKVCDTHDNKVAFDLHVDHPKHPTIPYRGMTLIKHHARQAVHKAIREAAKVVYNQ